jgi:hypothetical protein
MLEMFSIGKLFFKPIPVAVPFKAVCCRSLTGAVGPNLAGDMDVCLLPVLCVVKKRFLLRVDASSRGVLPCRCLPLSVSKGKNNL